MYNNPSNTLFIGNPVIFLPSCHSTNETALELAGTDSVTEGTTIITDEQTRGKGQRGNSWEAEPGKNLTFSIILKPRFLSADRQFELNIIVSLAIFDVLTNILGEKIKIKWPNDIFYENKKICGILIQNSIKTKNLEKSVVGIGINVNQVHFTEKKATSIALHKSEQKLENVFHKVCEALERRYLQLKEGKVQELKLNYINALYLFKTEALYEDVDSRFKGIITGIDEYGRLLMRKEGVEKAYNFKEVKYLEQA